MNRADFESYNERRARAAARNAANALGRSPDEPGTARLAAALATESDDDGSHYPDQSNPRWWPGAACLSPEERRYDNGGLFLSDAEQLAAIEAAERLAKGGAA